MIEVNKKINLYWTKNTNAFLAANPDLRKQDTTRLIGSAKSAVTKMLANGEEQRAIMNTVLGVDPYSQTSNWDKILANYWHSLSIIIPETGRILETGFRYDVDSRSTVHLKYLVDFLKSNKDIKTDKDLADYVEANVKEENKYRFGEPINAEDYILWRYCLEYGYVANSIEDISKSPKKIKFYLFSENERKDEMKSKHQQRLEVTKTYLNVIKDKALMDSILIVEGYADRVDDMDDIDKEQAIEGLSIQSPNKFLNLAKDKTIKVKAQIEQLIAANQLRRLPHTTKIVDSKDIQKAIGNDLDDAVIYWLDQKNKADVSEYIEVYKHNKKK